MNDEQQFADGYTLIYECLTFFEEEGWEEKICKGCAAYNAKVYQNGPCFFPSYELIGKFNYELSDEMMAELISHYKSEIEITREGKECTVREYAIVLAESDYDDYICDADPEEIVYISEMSEEMKEICEKIKKKGNATV